MGLSVPTYKGLSGLLCREQSQCTDLRLRRSSGKGSKARRRLRLRLAKMSSRKLWEAKGARSATHSPTCRASSVLSTLRIGTHFIPTLIL